MKAILDSGQVIDLGATKATPTIGITDYSRRVTDDFGVTTVVERGFSRTMSVQVAVPFDRVDELQRTLAGLRATPAQWVADDRFASLSIRGFYKEFSIDVATSSLSFCTLSVEGLAGTDVVADAGGDPAPEALRSTLQLLRPIAVAGAQLVASNVAEADAPEWAAGKAYPSGVRVIKAATHRIYESLAAVPAGDDPAAASGKWLDIGPTNRWAMFDQALGSVTTANGSIAVAVDVGAIDAVAVLDVVGATVRVQATDYDRTVPIVGGSISLLDLPNKAGRVTVTIAGNGTVSAGTLLVGHRVSLGLTEAAPTAGITDYSRKVVDDFGEVTVVERAWAKRMTANALIRTDAVDAVANRIAAVRAQPVLWIGRVGTDSLTIYGFFKDFSIEIGKAVSKLSLSIEGLSTAGKIEPLGTLVEWPDIADPTGTKPANNADKTSENTAADTANVGGRPAGTVIQTIDKAKADIDSLIASASENQTDLSEQVNAANAARDASQTARDQSQAARDAASAASTLSGAARDAAKTAQTNSEAAASTAAQRAIDASGYAQTATGQATIATQKADAAGQSASSASASATTASTKAGEASTSAQSAVTAKNDAAGSATSAGTSAGVATQAKTDAQAAASAASTSASTASSKADAAGQSATAAAGSATAANTSAGTASTKAGEASTSATNAAGSASSAASNSALAATAYNKTVDFGGNPNFDLGTDGWVGLNGSTVQPTAFGNTNVLTTPAGVIVNGIQTTKTYPINDSGQKFRISARYRPDGSNAAQIMFFMGIVFVDASGNIVAANDGTGNYPLGAGVTLTVGTHGWVDRWAIIGKENTGLAVGGTGGIAAGTVLIPAAAVGFRPILFGNYNGTSGGKSLFDYFRVEDVTSEVASGVAANAANTSASSAAASKSGADTSASAANQSKLDAQTALGGANAARDTAVTSATNAAGSANTAATQASLAASAGTAAVQNVASTLPSGFDPAATFWSSYFDGAPARANDLAAYSWVINNDGAFLRMGATGGTRDISHRGAIPLVKDRRLRMTALWRTDSAPRQPITSVLYFIGLNSSYASVYTPGKEISVSPGQIGWGGSDWKIDTYEFNTNDLIANGASMVRGLFRFTNTAPYEQNALRSLMITDVTSETAAQNSATAANTSASSASASKDAAGVSATAANQSRIDAQAANGAASGSASAAASSAVAANSSASQAQTSATLTAQFNGGMGNANANFSSYDAGSPNPPDKWQIWSAGALGGCYRGYGNGSLSDPNAAGGTKFENSGWSVTQQNSENTDAGIYQDVAYVNGGWLVVEATIRLNDGNFAGSGVLLYLLDANGSAVGTAVVNFATDADTSVLNPGVDAGPATSPFMVRRYRKLVYLPPNGSPNCSVRIYAMTNWQGFGSGSAYKQMAWFKCGWRAASAAEITAQRAMDGVTGNAARIESINRTLSDQYGSLAQRISNTEATAGSLTARTGITESAVADLRTKAAAARLEFSATSPGGRAAVTIRSDSNNGAGIDLVGDVAFTGNQGGAVTVVNGLGMKTYDANGALVFQAGIY